MYKLKCILITFLLFLVGCNGPSGYANKAEEYLKKKGVSSELIHKLRTREPFVREEAYKIFEYKNTSVLHLLGSNAGTPVSILEELAKIEDVDVRIAVAANRNTPLSILYSFRSPGKYTSVNLALSRNPQLPEKILLEMHYNGETSLTGLALNPNCPLEIMHIIADQGNQSARYWLAFNKNIPEEIIIKLEQDEDEGVLRELKRNKNYIKLKKINN